ncbi:MAG: chorismate synthase [Candidatus Gracilibacteria bacterium]|jgi:chorismate synthase
MLRFLTAGESHGKALTVVIDGLPAGVSISEKFIAEEMLKRKIGVGSGARQKMEDDGVEILSGLRGGKTIGSPLSMLIKNKDFENCGDALGGPVLCPRPGHADLAGVQKYGFPDARTVLERASARETAARVAAGAIFKQVLLEFGVKIASHTVQVGTAMIEYFCKKYGFEEVGKSYKNFPETRCINDKMDKAVQKLVDGLAGDTLGGAIEVWASGVPAGLGNYSQWDTRIDGRIAQAIMSIQSVKGVEIGDGFDGSGEMGSEFHDEIFYSNAKGFYRKTNHAGGVEGGITNGMPIVVRAHLKPISTLLKPLSSVNLKTYKKELASVERSDFCVVPRAGVVCEAMLAFVLLDEMLSKFGGDNLSDIKNSYVRYLKRIK